MTFSIHAEHLPSIKLVVSTKLAVYNSKSYKPNRSASLSEEKNLATIKNSHPDSSMAWFSACCISRQNSHNGKDELAGRTPTKDSDYCTPIPFATCTFTPAIALVVAPLVASGSNHFFVVGYSEDNLQRILRTILDFRPLALVPAPVIDAAPHYKDPHKRLLKAWFPDIYWDKTHLKCYNFLQ